MGRTLPIGISRRWYDPIGITTPTQPMGRYHPRSFCIGVIFSHITMIIVNCWDKNRLYLGTRLGGRKMCSMHF